MEQTIPAVSSGNVESKTSGPADLLKMIDAASGTGKGKNTQPGKEDEDINALVVPFLQLLNQQMALLFQTNKGSDTELVSKGGEKITLEQAKLLFQGNLDLKDLQQVLAKYAQSESPGNSLLKEISLLEKNLAAGDVQGKDILLNVALEQTSTEDTVSDEGNKAVNAITAALDKELGAISGDIEKIISNKNNSLNQSAAAILVDQKNSHSVVNDSLASMEAELKNTIGTKLAGEKANNNVKNEATDSEIELELDGKEKLSILKNDEKALQPEKVISKNTQIVEIPAGNVAMNSAAVKEENKINKNILPDEFNKTNDETHSNSRLSMQEMKEPLISKDNLRFAQEQYQNAAANTNAVNKEKIETMQAILGNLADKTKPEQKDKTISSLKMNDEISSSSINTIGSGPAKVENIKDISPSEIISQIKDGIKETAANDGGRVKITLNPPSLGTLEMDVTVRNGKVDVVLTADNKDVQQTLNSHIDKLKGSLQTQGLTIERCDVLMQDKREEYHQSFSQHAFYHQGSGQGNNGRQDNAEEKFKFNVTGAAEQRINILTTSTDKISLFA
jgi:flagellar hook-length control protein FliK